MTKYTLSYFPIKALAEGPRLLLAYGGEEWEDNRVTKEDWPAFKPKTIFGQMPVLEFDGRQYAQSMAIARYLGHKYNLAGADILEDLEINQNIEFYDDIRKAAGSVHYEQDEALKAAKHADNIANKYPFMLEKLNEIITKNDGHLALGKLTWADFVFTGVYDYLKTMLQMPDLDKKYPAFKKLYDTVLSLPRVKEYNAAAYPHPQLI